MLKVKNLSFKYPHGQYVLNDINIELPREKIIAILGESGSGKTTLLNCIAKFIKPQKGEILLDDTNIYRIDDKSFRESIGVVFQQLFLFPHLTILGNMMLALTQLERFPNDKAEQSAVYTLEKLGIDDLRDKYPSEISGGQAQRAAIARALVLKPKYLLLDEPTSALDIKTTEDFGKWLVNLRGETTFVLVTHDIFFTKSIATSAVLLADGKVKAEGGIDKVLNAIDFDFSAFGKKE